MPVLHLLFLPSYLMSFPQAVQMRKPRLPCTCYSTAVALNCTPCPTNKKTASHWIQDTATGQFSANHMIIIHLVLR